MLPEAALKAIAHPERRRMMELRITSGHPARSWSLFPDA
jgi:hypothetical protein